MAQIPLGPFQPDLTAGAQALHLPVAGQAGRQPARPVALRQAQVQVQLRVAPGLRAQPAVPLPGHRLAIGQQHAAVQTVLLTAAGEGQIQIIQAQRLRSVRMQDQLAVDHRHLRESPQLPQPVFRVQLAGIFLARQTLRMPAPIGVLADHQLQPADSQAGQARLPVQQAAEQIRTQAHLIQAQHIVALADQHVVGDQFRNHALPAAFQPADGQGRAQCVGGPLLDGYTVFGEQGHQPAAEADIQRGQHQQHGKQPERPARQADQQTQQQVHGVSGTIRAAPRRTAPGSIRSRPGT